MNCRGRVPQRSDMSLSDLRIDANARHNPLHSLGVVDHPRPRNPIMQKLPRRVAERPEEVGEHTQDPPGAAASANEHEHGKAERGADPRGEIADDGLLAGHRAAVCGYEFQMPRFEGERAAAVDPKIDEIRADAEEQVRLLKNRDGAGEYLRAARAHRFARK